MISPRALASLLLGLLTACTGTLGEPENGTPASPGPDYVPPETEVVELLPFAPANAVMPRLTASQYRNTLRDLFGDDLPATTVEADQNPYLYFNIGATTTTLSETGTQHYAVAAMTVTDAIFSDEARRNRLLGCTPSTADDGCVADFLERFGRRAYRRPLSEGEVARWKGLVRDTMGSDVHDGLRYAVAGMLQSPQFLYRIERGEQDPSDAGRYRYTSFEMASRISYLLWNTTPDAELLDAAAREALVDDGGLYEQAMRLLESPRSRDAVREFFAQYLDLGRLDRVERDAEVYAELTPTLTTSMRTELELLVDDFVFRRDADIRDLFDTRRTFVNLELATLYGVDAPSASAVAFVPVDLPTDGERRGLLTLGAFLTMNAHPTETSPTLRGKYVRERVLCQKVPAPPDNVDINLTDTGGTPRTLRERLEEHRTNPVCATCHAFIDPPGFLFEGYDSLGRFRTHEGEYRVDTTGELDGVPLADGRELGAVLRNDPRVPACMVRQLYRHANGRLELESEEEALLELTQAFAGSGYRFRDLLIELVLSRGFRTVAREVSE